MEEKKLTIAILSMYSGVVSRGAETFVHELSNNLIKRNNNVLVYQGGQSLPDSTYHVIQIPVSNHGTVAKRPIPFLNMRAFSVFLFTIKALQRMSSEVDVVVPTNGEWQTLLTKVWCVLYKKKMVVSGQSGPGLDDRINILCFPDAFVAISKVALNKAKTDNRFASSTYIPNGVDTKKFTPQGKRLKLTISKPVVLCVGAFVPEKHIELTIEAMSRLKKASLLIVGDGPLKKQLTKLATEKLSGRVQFLQVPHHHMPEVYRSADVFTLVSDSSEAFGIVYAEALASNLPVVARNDGARHEIIGKAGIFVNNPESVEDYKQALEKALSKNWKNAPRAESLKFDWGHIAEEYEMVFKAVLL